MNVNFFIDWNLWLSPHNKICLMMRNNTQRTSATREMSTEHTKDDDLKRFFSFSTLLKPFCEVHIEETLSLVEWFYRRMKKAVKGEMATRLEPRIIKLCWLQSARKNASRIFNKGKCQPSNAWKNLLSIPWKISQRRTFNLFKRKEEKMLNKETEVKFSVWEWIEFLSRVDVD